MSEHAGCVQERASRPALPWWSADAQTPGELLKLPLPRLRQLNRVSGAVFKETHRAITMRFENLGGGKPLRG